MLSNLGTLIGNSSNFYIFDVESFFKEFVKGGRPVPSPEALANGTFCCIFKHTGVPVELGGRVLQET